MPIQVKLPKLITYVFLPVLLSLIVSAVVNLQLFQDGSSYMSEVLVSGSAIRHHRFTVLLIQAPFIVIVKVLARLHVSVNDSLPILRLIFSLSYSLIPFISLLLCWLAVRRKKESLFIWTALIILFINLVNFSWVSELLIALQLLCPLLLASLAIPGTKTFWLLMALLLPIIFFLHPLIVPLLGTMALGSAYVGYKNIQIRKMAWLNATIFLIVAFLRGLLSLYSLTSYETSFLESEEMSNYLVITSWENKLFLLLALIIGLICLRAYSLTKSSPQKIRMFYLFGMSLGAIAVYLLLSQYIFDSHQFPLKTGLALFASMVIMLMASFDSLREIAPFEQIQRFQLLTILAILFSIAIVSKSWMWHSSLQKLEQSLAMSDSSCTEITVEKFTWLQKNHYNIINNWSLPTLALVVQDNHPRKLLLEQDSCRFFYETGMVQIDPWTNLPKTLLVPSVD